MKKRATILSALAATLASLVSAPSARAQTAAPRYYTVVNGDTLWEIAQRFHVSASELADRSHLTAPYALRRGMRLRLPSRAVAVPDPSPNAPTAPTAPTATAPTAHPAAHPVTPPAHAATTHPTAHPTAPQSNNGRRPGVDGGVLRIPAWCTSSASPTMRASWSTCDASAPSRAVGCARSCALRMARRTRSIRGCSVRSRS